MLCCAVQIIQTISHKWPPSFNRVCAATCILYPNTLLYDGCYLLKNNSPTVTRPFFQACSGSSLNQPFTMQIPPPPLLRLFFICRCVGGARTPFADGHGHRDGQTKARLRVLPAEARVSVRSFVLALLFLRRAGGVSRVEAFGYVRRRI